MSQIEELQKYPDIDKLAKEQGWNVIRVDFKDSKVVKVVLSCEANGVIESSVSFSDLAQANKYLNGFRID